MTCTDSNQNDSSMKGHRAYIDSHLLARIHVDAQKVFEDDDGKKERGSKIMVSDITSQQH